MGGGRVESESKVSEKMFEEIFLRLSFNISQEGWREAKYNPIEGIFSALI